MRQGREQDRASPARIQGVPAGASRELCTRLRRDCQAPSQRQSEKTEMALVRRPRLTKHPAKRACQGAKVRRWADPIPCPQSRRVYLGRGDVVVVVYPVDGTVAGRNEDPPSRIPHPASRRAQAKQRRGAAHALGEESATVRDGTAARPSQPYRPSATCARTSLGLSGDVHGCGGRGGREWRDPGRSSICVLVPIRADGGHTGIQGTYSHVWDGAHWASSSTFTGSGGEEHSEAAAAQSGKAS